MPELSRRRALLALGLAPLVGIGGAPARAQSGSLFSRIWQADQAANGVRPLLPDEPHEPATGFVVVDENAAGDPDHRLFPDVVIPEGKRRTYELAKALFDNYEIRQRLPEDMDQAEAGETLDLLNAVAGSPPMALVRDALGQRGEPPDDDLWLEQLFEIWFRPYEIGRNRSLTGFEHIVVGEANGEAVSGHHFWYRYYLDDGILGDDRIDWRGTRYDGPGNRAGRLTPLGRRAPEVVTLSYRWRTAAGTLFQEIGGFFVGCSVEGLMALGTALFFGLDDPRTTIGASRVELVQHLSPDRRSLRTFYPKFIGLA